MTTIDEYDEEARRPLRLKIESEATAAWGRLGKMFEDWVTVARAVVEARDYCLYLARQKNRRPEAVTIVSQVYRNEMERYAQTRSWLSDLSRNTRSCCYWLIENLGKVEEWRTQLGFDPAHKANRDKLQKFNHPAVVQREFWRANPHLKPGADPDAPKAERMSPTAKRDEIIEQQQREIKSLKEDAKRSLDFDGGFNWETTEPRDIIPAMLDNPVKTLKLYDLLTPRIEELKKRVAAARAKQTRAAEKELAAEKAKGNLLGPSRPSKARRMSRRKIDASLRESMHKTDAGQER
jgi:hypothetical protein